MLYFTYISDIAKKYSKNIALWFLEVHSVTSYDSVVHDTLKFLLAPSALAFTTLKIKNVEKSSKLSIATSAANN